MAVESFCSLYQFGLLTRCENKTALSKGGKKKLKILKRVWRRRAETNQTANISCNKTNQGNTTVNLRRFFFLASNAVLHFRYQLYSCVKQSTAKNRVAIKASIFHRNTPDLIRIS